MATLVALAGATAASPARAIDLSRLAGKAAGAADGGASGKAVKEVNDKLLAEGRKNQCSFKTDSDQLMPGCDAKLKKLADALVDAKKRLQMARREEPTSSRSPATPTRAARPTTTRSCPASARAVIVKELVARGIAPSEIIAVGMGSEQPAGQARQHAGQEGQEPPLRDPAAFLRSLGISKWGGDDWARVLHGIGPPQGHATRARAVPRAQ